MIKEFLTAENAEIDMETLRIAQDIGHQMTHKRLEAAIDVVDAFIKALYPEDRQRYEAYLKENDPCHAEEK